MRSWTHDFTSIPFFQLLFFHSLDCIQHAAQKAFYANIPSTVHEAWVKVQQLPAKYPKVPHGTLPTPVTAFFFTVWLTNLALDDQDFVGAAKMVKMILNPMMIGGMFGGGNFCHVESMYRYFADPLIKLKKYAETNGQQEDVFPDFSFLCFSVLFVLYVRVPRKIIVSLICVFIRVA